MFPACCFRQRTCVAQGLVIGVLNETWTHSCFQFKWPLVGQVALNRGHSPSFLESVYFGLLYLSLIFDMFIVVCICVCVSIGVGVVLRFTNSFFPFFSLCVWMCVLRGFVVLNLLVILSPFLVYVYTYLCVYIYMYVCFQLFSFVWEHVWHKV